MKRFLNSRIFKPNPNSNFLCCILIFKTLHLCRDLYLRSNSCMSFQVFSFWKRYSINNGSSFKTWKAFIPGRAALGYLTAGLNALKTNFYCLYVGVSVLWTQSQHNHSWDYEWKTRDVRSLKLQHISFYEDWREDFQIINMQNISF